MIKKLIGTLAVTMLFAASANAATMSITGPTDADVGTDFQLQIFGDFGPEGLNAGGVQFFWDAALVSLNSITLHLPVISDFSCPGSPACPVNPDNAYVVWGEFLGVLIAPDAGNVLMATLDFSADNAAAEGSANFNMISGSLFTGGWTGANGAPIDEPDFGAGYQVNINPAVIPLPAAVWFMIGGLGTLLGFRRK